MQIISLPKKITDLKIFPDAFENNENIFYHGTSAIYSNQIEEFGLFPNHKPLTQYFYYLYELADKIYTFTDGNNDFETFNKVFTDAFQYFKDFTRISFSAISISAAHYSVGKMAGGQGLRHLVNLKTELDRINYALLENANINISENHIYHYENINNEIDKIKKSNGVVYAFEFDNSDKIHLSYNNHSYHSVLLSLNHIHPSKIVGKIMIPNTLKLDQNLIEEGNKKSLELNNIVNTTSFIREIIFQNMERNNIHDYFNPEE